MIIIPSMPRLSTPERSTINSPADARSSGVEAVMTVRIKLTEKINCMTSRSVSNMGWHGLSHGSQQADAVNDQRIAGQHVEQQDSLKNFGEVERDLHRNLRALAADEGQREKQAGDQNAHRIEPPQEGDDDGGEAVARRHTRVQMPDRSGHLDDAGEAGQRARNRKGEQDQPIRIEAGKMRRTRGGSDQPDLKSHDHAPEENGHQHHDDK